MNPDPYSRYLVALGTGLIAGAVPNRKSNIHPLILGVLLAVLVVKILFGDFDVGYQWTTSDLWFGTSVGAVGAFGAWITQKSLV